MSIYQGSSKISGAGAIWANCPIGTVIEYLGSNLPIGYLRCDGSEISKTDYSELYSVIGDTFGTSSDSAKFKLPTKGSTYLVKARNFNVEGSESLIYDDSLYVKKSEIDEELSYESENLVSNKVITKSLMNTFLYATGSVTPTYGSFSNVASVKIDNPGYYLILGQITSNKGSGTIILGEIRPNSDITALTTTYSVRTTMDAGGGCSAWRLVKVTTSGIVYLRTYGYDDMDYTITGDIAAIKLHQ